MGTLAMVLSKLNIYGVTETRTPGDFVRAFLMIAGGVVLFLFLEYSRGRVKPDWLSFVLKFISPIIPIIATIVAVFTVRRP